MIDLQDLKICSQCGLEKSLVNFPFENKELFQYRANCKDCKNGASKKAYEETRSDPESVARRIIKKCKEREKYRLAKFVQRKECLEHLPDVELTSAEFDIDYSWVLAQRDLQDNKCFYTGRNMIWSTGLIDDVKRMNPDAVTVERLNSNGSYIRDNCVLVTWRANCFKGDGLLEEMYEYAFDIIGKLLIDKGLDPSQVSHILSLKAMYK